MQKKELSDLTSRGKERPWKKHKSNNKKVVAALQILNDLDKAHKLEQCGNVLEFGECPNGHGKRLKKAYFCKDRVCSLCNWRKSLFTFAQFLLVAHKLLELYPNTIFLFHTITMRNCATDELSEAITHLSKSFKRYLGYKRIKSAFKGAFRTLETTYNPLSDTFHPHIHSVVAVNKNYFVSRGYIPHAELQQLCKKALKVDYNPDLDIRRVKPKRRGIPSIHEEIELMDKALMENALIAGGAEVAKYFTKVADILSPVIKPEDSPEMIRAKLELGRDPERQARVLGQLINGIERRHLIAYTGIFREAYQALNCTDVEDSDLILMPGEESVCTCKICQSELVQVYYVWNGEGYFERLWRIAKSPKSKTVISPEARRTKEAYA